MNTTRHRPLRHDRRQALQQACATTCMVLGGGLAGGGWAQAAGLSTLLLKLGDDSLTVLLDDHATARDFASLLPLRLTLEDYAATEKIASLPRALSLEGAPAGYTPVAGDAAYYAPWGNLALFHKGFRHSAGLVRLGRISQGVQRLAVPGRVAAELVLAGR